MTAPGQRTFRPTAAFGNIDSLANAVGAPGDRSITERLDTIERVLFALARAQGIDPDTAP
ncbi:hypothetical protein [Streptomyces sp. NEAU-174]|uniref:hypothetical protein n=1 Tax=Streptomyces sp. NEAU-174 TaxID=3458254 RepID=UPI004044924F